MIGQDELLEHLPKSFRVLTEFAMKKEQKATGAGETPVANSAHLPGGADYARDSPKTA